MSGLRSYAIQAQVKIVRAVNRVNSSAASAEDGPIILDSREMDLGIELITTINSVNSPFGQFTIQFQPKPIYRGRTLPELVTPYSLVAISMHRYGYDSSCTREPEPVMLGLVSCPGISEHFGQAAPVRGNSISGHSLTSLLVDHRYWTHHWLFSVTDEGKKTDIPWDFREYFLQRPDGALLRDEFSLRALGALAIDPELLLLSNRDPISAAARIWEFYITGVRSGELVPGIGRLSAEDAANARRLGVLSGPSESFDREPFVKIMFGDDKPLRQRLRFDAERARSSFVDPAARLMQQLISTNLENASCWDFFRMYSDPHAQELFSDTFGSSIDDAYIEVISRKKPFRGSIGYDGRGAAVDFASRSQQTNAQLSDRRPKLHGDTLFDDEFGEWWVRERDTVYIDHVLGRPQLQRGVGPIYNLYWVYPNCSASQGTGQGDQTWMQVIPPIIDEDPASPSFINTFGVRPLQHQTMYIPALLEDEQTRRNDGDLIRHSLSYATLFREWNYRNPLMWSGTYTVEGRTGFRAGRRLVDRQRGLEFYIHTVRHTMTLGDATTFRSHLGVSRGWETPSF